MKALLPLLLLLTLPACSPSDDAPPSASEPLPTVAVPEPVAPVLVLRPGGLALDSRGDRQDLPFGAGTGVVVPALAETLGEPAQQPVTCPRGPRTAVTRTGLTALFDGDVLVGWSTDAPGVRTDTGLQVGSTDEDVRRALPRAVLTTRDLGGTYTAGPLRVDVGDARTVTRLSSGETCDR